VSRSVHPHRGNVSRRHHRRDSVKSDLRMRDLKMVPATKRVDRVAFNSMRTAPANRSLQGRAPRSLRSLARPTLNRSIVG
jgi:hypothetical protein